MDVTMIYPWWEEKKNTYSYLSPKKRKTAKQRDFKDDLYLVLAFFQRQDVCFFNIKSESEGFLFESELPAIQGNILLAIGQTTRIFNASKLTNQHLPERWGVSWGFTWCGHPQRPGGCRKIGEGPFAAARGGIFVRVSGQGETMKRGAATESCDICQNQLVLMKEILWKQLSICARGNFPVSKITWTIRIGRSSFCSTQMIQIQRMINIIQCLA